MPLSLKVLVHRELTEKRDGHRVGSVALLRLGEQRVAAPGGAPSNFPQKSARTSARALCALPHVIAHCRSSQRDVSVRGHLFGSASRLHVIDSTDSFGLCFVWQNKVRDTMILYSARLLSE